MLVNKDIKQILHHLADGDSINIPFDGTEITIRFVDRASKLSLSTSVYEGGNYIPSSVRRSLSDKFPFYSQGSIPTFFTVDEQNFKVNLNYLGQNRYLNSSLNDLLEDFGLIAEKWRVYLEDQGEKDLIHVKK